MREIVAQAAQRLATAGIAQPRLEAQRLLAHVLGCDRGGIVARHPDPLAPEDRRRFQALLIRREAREPLQYLTGEQEFRGRSFAVDRRVLVPRPETEELVEAVLALPLPPAARVIDWGTGSGCIAVSLAVERPGWTVTAVDIDDGALEVARANARRHRAVVEFLQLSLDDLVAAHAGSLDLLVSNPPYVSESEWHGLEPEVRDHEPKLALVPGLAGSEAYADLAPAARAMLSRGGYLAWELGYRSENEARRFVATAGFGQIEVRPDLRGIPRILIASL